MAADAFARAIRKNCSECGWPDGMEWMKPEGLLALVRDDERANVEFGLEFVGSGGDAWFCHRCAAYGLMGGTVSEWG